MDKDLDHLATLKAPSPDAARKAQALAAAMAEFDRVEKMSPATQGSANGERQSSIVNLLWRSIMNRKLLATSALATLLVVPAAGFITFQVVGERMGGYVADKQPEAPVLADAKLKKDQPVTQLEERRVANTPVARKTEQAVTDALVDKDDAAPVADAGTTAADSEDESGVLAGRLAAPGADQNAIASGIVGKSEQAPAESVVAEEAMPDARVMAPATMQTMEAAKPMIVGEMPMPEPGQQSVNPADGDRFTAKDVNPVKTVASEPVSTFSIDVDTASYAYMRQAITGGQLPEADTVRVEEMINYFPYDWKPPESADQAFRSTITVTPTPWNENTRLMHIAIKGYDVKLAQQPSANLVFLIDVSGSMDEPNKLPLLKSAFRLLVGKLKPTDTVAIVTYAGNSGIVLEPTKAAEREKILAAIDNLQPGGSTAGAEGIATAYELAKRAFVKDGVNRVMLATDGDFNVGPSSDDELKAMIEDKRKSGIFLSVLGFGTGNYNDGLMQTLAQNGNGTAAYIDTLSEAQKALVEEASSSLFPIAKDVKIQVEFNPARIAEYRLIGYETRALKREDFNNDKIDAGEIGSGHRVTAIYEVTPKGSPAVMNDDLRYGENDKPATEVTEPATDELAFVKIRYKQPDADKSQLVTQPVTDKDAVANLSAAPADIRFSIAVAAFGQKLKKEDQVSNYGYDKIIDMANGARGEDSYGYRTEFVNLVRLAKGLTGE